MSMGLGEDFIGLTASNFTSPPLPHLSLLRDSIHGRRISNHCETWRSHNRQEHEGTRLYISAMSLGGPGGR